MVEDPSPGDQLKAAIDAAVREESTFPDVVLTEYVVVASYAGRDTEGEVGHGVTIIPAGALHRMLGLLAEAKVRFTAEILDSYRRDL